MSNDVIELELEKREVLGKGLQKVRDAGKVPAVIHNHGKDSIHVSGDVKQMAKVYSEAGGNHPVEVTVGKKKFFTLIKDVDFAPIKNNIRHIVFQTIRRGETVEAEVPVIFKEGVVIPAEQNSLLVLKSLDSVQVKAIPSKLPDHLEVDPSTLKDEGDTVTVGDIVVPEGVVILDDPSTGIAAVEVPKDQLAEADAAAEALAEDAERAEAGEEAAPTEQPAEDEEGDEADSDEVTKDSSDQEKSE